MAAAFSLAGRPSFLARITHRQNFPLVAIGLVPVDHATAIMCVDLHIHRPSDRTAILDAGRLDTTENPVELYVVDAEAKVIDRELLIRLYEVECQALVDV